MPAVQLGQFIDHVRRALLGQDRDGLSDGALLEAFLTQREEGAFEALVRRHGPMVWGVCKRILRNDQDAEDAFQATFLVLARKGASVKPKDMVGNWLHGVACHTAMKSRVTDARRRAREKQVGEMSRNATGEDEKVWDELLPVLDQELNYLPTRYKAPIVLCDLQGMTRREAAQAMGCTEGTLSGRLSRARELLARRVGRRGVAVTGAALAVGLTQNTASASVPATLIAATAKSAMLFTAGNAPAVAGTAGLLADGIIKSMFIARLKVAALVLLGFAAIGTGTGILVYQGIGEQNTSLQESSAEAQAPALPLQENREPDVAQFPSIAEQAQDPGSENKESVTVTVAVQPTQGADASRLPMDEPPPSINTKPVKKKGDEAPTKGKKKPEKSKKKKAKDDNEGEDEDDDK